MANKLRVLIVGADGFIGRNLTRYLAQRNCEVWANVLASNEVTENLCELPNVQVVISSVRDVATHIKTEMDVVVHLAWRGVRPEERKLLDIQLENVDLALSCALQAETLGAKKFITPGSTSEYLYGNTIITENPIPSPRDAYGRVKVAVRFLLEQLLQEKGIQFVYPIITGIYSEDRRDNNVVYYTIEKLLMQEKPVLSALIQPWDYIHLDDVLEALYLLITKDVGGKVYPIGHGDNWPLKNYIMIIRDLIDNNAPLGIGELPYQSNEIPSSCMDLTAIQRDVGFVPKIPFEEGASRMIARMKQELNL